MSIIYYAAFIVAWGIASTSTYLNHGSGFFNSFFPAIAAILIAGFPLIYGQANQHAEQIKSNVWPNHWKASAWRLLGGSIFCAPMLAYAWNWWQLGELLAFGACYFGVMFNFILNRKRGKAWFYVGLVDGNDGISDTIFIRFRYGGQLLFALELIGMIIFGYLFLNKTL